MYKGGIVHKDVSGLVYLAITTLVTKLVVIGTSLKQDMLMMQELLAVPLRAGS